MSVAQALDSALSPLLPLSIESVEFEDPTLVVVGDRWSLAITYGWVWRDEVGEVVAEWRESDAADAVWDLIGHAIVAVEPLDSRWADVSCGSNRR